MPKATAGPSISVALCTHNGAAYVRAQVESILAQTRPVDEIVVSDDASTDDTVKIVRDAVASHKVRGGQAVTLRVLENRVAIGVVGNFEQAVTATTGDFVALCDQDDVWHEERIATILAEFTAEPANDLVFSDARLVDGAGVSMAHSLFEALSMTRRERNLLRNGNAFEALLGRNLVTGATAVFRRSLLGAAIPFAVDWIHDEWLATLAAATGGVRMLNAELIDYRQHGDNQIGAGRLTFAQKVGRVREVRTERNARLLGRSLELVDRLVELGDRVPARTLAQARAKADHEVMRSGLPARRFPRIPAITREIASGRYARYGRGLLDAARDLVQPAR
ncbi:MAG TPA: glycosyltransferase family 2 protein [Galbitalea sp.]|nr:glycosyltransferase family 2 protein [Galbitalea sp.]